MGGVQSRAQMIKRFNKIKPQKWDIVRKQGLTQIAVDAKGRQGQVSIVKLDPTKKPEEELQVYYYRRTFDGPLVKAYGAQSIQQKSMGVCGADNAMKVITERIVKRWGELPQLTFPQILYSLTQALEGYQTLHKEVGIFQVNHNMMGLNNQGELHVWLNENFADNNPALEKGILYTAETDKLNEVNTEGEMINNILKVVEDKCEEGKFPQKFSEIIYTRNNKFNDAIDAVDSYIESNSILVPSKIHLDNSKMYVSKLKKMQVVSGSRAIQQQNATANRVSFSPIKSDIKNYDYSIMSSAIKQQKVGNSPSITNNNVFQTTYVRNEPPKQIMTPKHVTFGTPKQGKFSSEYKPSPGVSGGYYTGSQGVSIPSASLQANKFTDLRLNPNIDVAESIYEAKQKTPLRSNETSGIKPITFNTGLVNDNLNQDRSNDHQKIQIIGNRTFATSNSPNINKGTATFSSDAQGTTILQSNQTSTKVQQVATKPASMFYSFSPQSSNKTSIKFNYVAPQSQTYTQKTGIASLGAPNQASPSLDENKIVMETSQVTKQY